MPRFEPDPTKVSATIEILDKDDYEFLIESAKTFMRKNRKGEDSYGIRYLLSVAAGRKKGTKIPYSLYQQSDGAQSMAKQFLMAAYGFPQSKVGEKQFDEATAGADWSFDTDSGALGDAWRRPVGKRVMCAVDMKIDEMGNPQQVWSKWRPLE